MVRAYWLLNEKFKRIVPILSMLMILFQLLVFINLDVICVDFKKHFLTLRSFTPAQLVSNLISIIIFLIAFVKIIKLIDKSEFAKSNPKMQLIRSMSKYSLLFAISVKLIHTGLDATSLGYVNELLKNGAMSIALRSNLVVFLMVSQFTLELTKQADDESTHSGGDSNSKKNDTGSFGKKGPSSRRPSNGAPISGKRTSFRDGVKKPDHIIEVNDSDEDK